MASMQQDIRQARDGGAHRVELCAQMQEEGLTPSLEAVSFARDNLPEQTLLVMLRPRAGSFVYSVQEHENCLEVVSTLKANGADGIVVGPLVKDGLIDSHQLGELIDTCRKHQLQASFHRAFDAVENRLKAWKYLADVGVDRVLTSGTPWGSAKTALQGVDNLLLLSGDIQGPELVVGGGVSIDNAETLLKALRPTHDKLSLHCYSGVMTYGQVDPVKVRALVELCDSF